jgi:hypothetical protein
VLLQLLKMQSHVDCFAPKDAIYIHKQWLLLQASLLTASAGMDAVFFARADYQDTGLRRASRNLEVVWAPEWPSSGAEAGVFAGTLPDHYGPPQGFNYDWGQNDTPIQVCTTSSYKANGLADKRSQSNLSAGTGRRLARECHCSFFCLIFVLVKATPGTSMFFRGHLDLLTTSALACVSPSLTVSANPALKGMHVHAQVECAGLLQDDVTLEGYNLPERVNAFLAAAAAYANTSAGDDVMLLMGTDFTYANAQSWYKNLDKLISGINKDGRAEALYSTPAAYLERKWGYDRVWGLKVDDYFPYADGPGALWTGACLI